MSTSKRTLLESGVPHDGEEPLAKRRALARGGSFSRGSISVHQDMRHDTRETGDRNDGVSHVLRLGDHCALPSMKSGVSDDTVTGPEYCFGMVSSSVDAF